MRPSVRVDLIRQLADLYAWGFSMGWWALVGWSVDGWVDGHRGLVDCVAWVPARHVWPVGDPDVRMRARAYQDVPRLVLPADSANWPTVHTRGKMVRHNFGVITTDPGPPPQLQNKTGSG